MKLYFEHLLQNPNQSFDQLHPNIKIDIYPKTLISYPTYPSIDQVLQQRYVHHFNKTSLDKTRPLVFFTFLLFLIDLSLQYHQHKLSFLITDILNHRKWNRVYRSLTTYQIYVHDHIYLISLFEFVVPIHAKIIFIKKSKII